MWQGSGGAAKSGAPKIGARSVRGRSRARHRRELHMKRVAADIKQVSRTGVHEETATPVRVVLNDFSPKGVGLFMPNHVNPGYEILISMNDPKRIDLHGRVVWCQQFNINSQVISSQSSYKYRVGVEFVFSDPSEAKAIEEFCKDLLSKYVYTAREMPPEAPPPTQAEAAAVQAAAEAAGDQITGADVDPLGSIPDSDTGDSNA